ncbi:MAG: DUF6242 domain-containing protein [Muribaculaceae bacterium]
MTIKTAFWLTLIAVVATAAGCNDDGDGTQFTSQAYSSVALSSFHITANNDKTHLDSVYFSIDLERAQIYNADSLPYGSDVTALVPVVMMQTGASVAEFKFKTLAGEDTVSNYLTNSTNPVNFAAGPVELRIVSLDGTAERIYTVKVNVHTVNQDSLYWGELAYSTLPSKFAAPTRQHTVRRGETIYCLTGDVTGSYCMASSTDPAAAQWRLQDVAFGFEPDVDSFTATDDTFYILDTAGNLYGSSDTGATWTQCSSAPWRYIFGAVNGSVVGSALRDGQWVYVTYPETAEEPIAADFPVSGLSQAVTLSTSLSGQESLLFVGGRLADGTLTNRTYGYDGVNWAQLSTRAIPEALEDAVIWPYATRHYSTSWKATDYDAIFAMGGRRSDGSINDTVYVSENYGITWAKASASMQLPEGFATPARAQAFVSDITMPGDRAAASRAWHTILSCRRPYDTRPIEEWECPYIYIFGGVDKMGTLYNTVWQGVILRYTFKPIQ